MRALKREGLRSRESGLKVTSPDPEYTVKRQRVEKLKEKAEAGELTSDDVASVMPGMQPISPYNCARLYLMKLTSIGAPTLVMLCISPVSR